MKKILTLEKAISIKEGLDEKLDKNKNLNFISIEKDNILIEENNSIKVGEEREIDLQKIENQKEKKHDSVRET